MSRQFNYKTLPAKNKKNSFNQTGRNFKLKDNALSSAKEAHKPYLPRLEKQKVLDRFIDLSTADVFNRTALSSINQGPVMIPTANMNMTQ